jgi:ABC-type glycerol-3-phosphate transport system permease component
MLELRGRRGRLILEIVTMLLVAPFLYPLVVMVWTSFQGQGAWANYGAVLSQPLLPRFFLNSAIIAGGTVLVTYVATMLAAFAFSKLRLPWKELVFYVLLAALTLPPAVLMVPLFVTVMSLGLFDTHLAVILPLAALGIPFSVVMARTYIDGLPDELLDAATIDGATTLQAFWLVILPLCGPIAAVIVVWSMLGAWNEYLLPLLLLQDPAKQTVTQLPSFFVSAYSRDDTKIITASVITSLPVVLVYLGLQRFIERGLTAGAVK